LTALPPITPFAITILVHPLICTRVDYGNAVYTGLSSTNASKLQAFLIAAAHLIGKCYSNCGLRPVTGPRRFTYGPQIDTRNLYFVSCTFRTISEYGTAFILSLNFKILLDNIIQLNQARIICMHLNSLKDNLDVSAGDNCCNY